MFKISFSKGTFINDVTQRGRLAFLRHQAYGISALQRQEAGRARRGRVQIFVMQHINDYQGEKGLNGTLKDIKQPRLIIAGKRLIKGQFEIGIVEFLSI